MADNQIQQMKHVLRALFHYTIEQIDLSAALDRAWQNVEPPLRSFISGDTSDRGNLFVIAFGKASVPMTNWFLDKVGVRRPRGIVSGLSIPPNNWQQIDCFEGGHPVPNESSVNAARAALEMVKKATADDLIVYLISGGGSSLFELPIADEVPLVDVRTFYGTLVTCGADIVEINTLRKHLSAVKGGRLAAASAARHLTFYVSDVPDNHDSSVASGPTVPDDSTLDDCHRILTKYELHRRIPTSIDLLFSSPASLPETPKPDHSVFQRSFWIRVLDNSDAIKAACCFAENEGWAAIPDISVDGVDEKTAAKQLLARLFSAGPVMPGGRPVCIVSGGELNVAVSGRGVGGRNQAFVLECARQIAGKRIAVLSAGTDGIDGNSPAAGAVADGRTLERAGSFGLDPAEFSRNSDAYTFFETLGDTVICGPTQNNVRDIRALLSW